jgi:hypothetical protein
MAADSGGPRRQRGAGVGIWPVKQQLFGRKSEKIDPNPAAVPGEAAVVPATAANAGDRSEKRPRRHSPYTSGDPPWFSGQAHPSLRVHPANPSRAERRPRGTTFGGEKQRHQQNKVRRPPPVHPLNHSRPTKIVYLIHCYAPRRRATPPLGKAACTVAVRNGGEVTGAAQRAAGVEATGAGGSSDSGWAAC